MIIKKVGNVGHLIVLAQDKVGRADSRLVVALSRMSRELKGKFNSLYHYEDDFKHDREIGSFPIESSNIVTRIVRQNGFELKNE